MSLDAEVLELMKSTYPPELKDSDGGAPPLRVVAESLPLSSLRTIRADQVEIKSIVWLDKPLLQGSAFHLVAGPKGVGKGTWTARQMAQVTSRAFGDPRNVVIVSSEDSASIDLVPRLKAAGADLSRVHIVAEHVTLPVDLDRLREYAAELGSVGMIVLDPLGNHLGGADTDREGAVRFAISGLNQLADDLGCVVLGIRHISKNRQNGAVASVLGSTAWVDLPRAVLMFAPDDEDEMVFHVQVVAGNRSGRGAARSYRIELTDVGLTEPVTKAVELGQSTKDVEDLLQSSRRVSKSGSARELILDILEGEGNQGSDALDARVAAESGLSAKTVRNQRGALKNEGLVKNVPTKDEFGTVLHWKVVRTSAPRTTGVGA